MRQLHVALVAIACSPYKPSEGGLGWKVLLALAERYCVTVFTHSNSREDIDRYLTSSDNLELVKNVSFVFVSKPHGHMRNQAVARMLNWHYYRQWLGQCVDAVSEHSSTREFDLVHHVTYSTWRMGSPFYKTGLATIWGPVGGAGSVPWSAYGILSPFTRGTEALRSLLSSFYRLTPAFRNSLDRNTVVLASNEETRRFLQRYTKRSVEVVFPTYFEVGEAVGGDSDCDDGVPLRCFYGGGIIGSKGISLSLRAIARARERGAVIEFKIAGHGPETGHLIKLAEELDISEYVTFLPMLSGDDYRDVLEESDVFLFPSFRENIGITMVDAMLHESAPIVLDTSAPGEIVAENCGWKVAASDPTQITEDLVKALLEAAADREMLKRRQQNAKIRIVDSYSKQTYLEKIDAAYESVAGPQGDDINISEF